MVSLASFDSLVLLTDQEPDDAVANAILLRGSCVPTVIVVGEGRIIKRKMMHVFVERLGRTDVCIIQSALSDHDYPEAALDAIMSLVWRKRTPFLDTMDTRETREETQAKYLPR